MTQQARFRLPPELDELTKPEMLRLISEANLGAENERIARLYLTERLPQVDVAAELYLGRSTVQRRIHEILNRMEKVRNRILH